MDGQLSVELADLRGWAAQVGRAGDDCAYLADYVTTFVPDGDFGRILTLVTPDYEHLGLRVREALALDASRLSATGIALRYAAVGYAHTDALVAQDFGVGAAIGDDGRVAPGFRDTGATTPPVPACRGEVLPEVTFGAWVDRASDLVAGLGGPDLRREITDLVAGDIGKAAAQASAWEHAGQALLAVRGHLVHGSHLVGRSWAGAAAAASREHTAAFVRALDIQSEAMSRVAAYLRDVVEQALDVAQLVVDIIKEIVSIVVAGWTFASIPIFGQVQLVDKVADAVRLACDARKVLLVFWNFLLVVKDGIVLAADAFAAEALPAAPSLPPSAA